MVFPTTRCAKVSRQVHISSLPRPLLKAYYDHLLVNIHFAAKLNPDLWGGTYYSFTNESIMVGNKLNVRVRAVGSHMHGIGADTVKACGESQINDSKANDGHIRRCEPWYRHYV